VALAFYGLDLATVIMAARAAQIVGALEFAAIRAFLIRLHGESIVRPAHAPPGRRGLSLWDGHLGTFFE
jgi:hypothetical protein